MMDVLQKLHNATNGKEDVRKLISQLDRLLENPANDISTIHQLDRARELLNIAMYQFRRIEDETEDEFNEHQMGVVNKNKFK